MQTSGEQEDGARAGKNILNYSEMPVILTGIFFTKQTMFLDYLNASAWSSVSTKA